MSDPCPFCGKPQHPMISCREANPPQCHDAFHAGRASVAAEVKPTHEERARAFCLARNFHEDWIKDLAAAFAEVEEEAKDEVCAEPENYGLARTGYSEIKPSYDPGTSGLPVPQFCQECGKKPCESFVACMAKVSKRHFKNVYAYQNPPPMLMADADGGREAVVPLRACTCGAASCGSRIHSSWCDAA